MIDSNLRAFQKAAREVRLAGGELEDKTNAVIDAGAIQEEAVIALSAEQTNQALTLLLPLLERVELAAANLRVVYDAEE